MNQLYDKILGCLGAAVVGSAMGGPVENYTRDEIQENYGFLDRMVPYPSGGTDKHNSGFPAGSTEDGVERMKLLALSVIEKGGPITARDFARTWLKYVNEDSFGKLAGQQDEIHYRLLKAGISPEDSGYYDAHIGRMGFNRACQPLGIINACHPEDAARNALDVARIFQPPSGRGLQWKDNGKIFPAYSIGIDWSASIAAAIAEAFREDSTIESVVEQSIAYVVEPVQYEIRSAVELAAQCQSYEELTTAFNRRYHAVGMPMAASRAYEITSKGIALFAYCKGNVRDAILYAVNFGRDTDCLAAVAGGIAGAFSGSAGLEPEWMKIVDEATLQNPYTVTQASIAEMAGQLYQTVISYQDRRMKQAQALEQLR